MDLHKRHIFYWNLLHYPVELYIKLKFGYKYKKTKPKELPETYIVLSNHVTDFDPIFVGVSFQKQMYFVASEHVSRWGFLSKLLNHAFAPIIRYKGTTAASTVLEMIRKVKEGKCVCMFAEGARSWDGVTAHIQSATGKVIKSAKCALITYRIDGGYFVSPNWSEGGTRKGRISGEIVNVYTKEQVASMTVDEINQVINNDLYVDAYARQLEEPAKYIGKQPAVRMENLLFICPKCGSIDTIYSQKDTVGCHNCDMQFKYTDYAMLEGVPFQTVKELYAWQKEEIKKAAAGGTVIYTAKEATLQTVSKGNEKMVAQGVLTLSKEKLVCGEYEIPFESILDMAMHGRHALVFSTKEAYYELMPGETENALKFHLLYELYKTGNIK